MDRPRSHAASSDPDADPDAETLRRRNRELRILNTIAEALNASVDLSTLLETALARVAELLNLETGWVLLLDPETHEPYTAAAQNLPPGLADEPERMSGWCYCLSTFCDGELQAAANVDIVTCSRLKELVSEEGEEGTNGLRFHASIPLRTCHGDTVRRLGMLNVASAKWRRLDPEELQLLHTIGDMLGVAIGRARLHERSLAAAQTEERNRLARDIHDTLAQSLSAITLQLEAADALLEQDADREPIRDRVDTALTLTRKGLDEARRSVLDLRAAPLEGRTLTGALQALVEARADEAAATLTFEPPHDGRSLPSRVEVGLYRIAQEALNNALQHAAAQHITLCLAVTPDEVRLSVDDDGRGFDGDRLEEDAPQTHFGLVGLRERARLLGGHLRVESSPGVGTCVEASVPLSGTASSAAERAPHSASPATNDDCASRP